MPYAPPSPLSQSKNKSFYCNVSTAMIDARPSRSLPRNTLSSTNTFIPRQCVCAPLLPLPALDTRETVYALGSGLLGQCSPGFWLLGALHGGIMLPIIIDIGGSSISRKALTPSSSVGTQKHIPGPACFTSDPHPHPPPLPTHTTHRTCQHHIQLIPPYSTTLYAEPQAPCAFHSVPTTTTGHSTVYPLVPAACASPPPP